MNLSEGPELDAIVAAVAQRLAGRFPNPAQPDPERPPLLWDPPHQLPDELWPRLRLALAGLELTQSIQYNGAVGSSWQVIGTGLDVWELIATSTQGSPASSR